MEPTTNASPPAGWQRGAARPADVPAFGPMLRELRERRDLQMKELAERAGISESFISRLESGDRGLSRETVDALADALAVSSVERYRMLVAAQCVAPLGPPLDALVEVLWDERLPAAAYVRLIAAVEIAVAYGQAALAAGDTPR